jgi:hypothetical protein
MLLVVQFYKPKCELGTSGRTVKRPKNYYHGTDVTSANP